MKKIFFKIILGLFSTLLVLVILIQLKFHYDQAQIFSAASFSLKEQMVTADAALGKRLFTVRNGCIECHGADLSGAVVMDNPAMGSIHGTNITPYTLSSWTDEEIARAIRYGIHKSGHSLQFMPSFDFQELSMSDIASLVAYLRSVPAVNKPNHQNSFGPIAKMLSCFGKMPVMFPAKIIDLTRSFSEKPPEAPTREFGKYLANSCTGCHGDNFVGGQIPGGDPAWPKASNIRLGANPVWTEALFTEAIKSGISPLSKQKLRAPMPTNLLAQMNEMEIKALWEYLHSLN